VPAPRTSRQSPQWPTLNRLTRRTSDMHNSKIHHDIQHIITNTTVNAHSRTHSGLPNLAKPKTLSPKAQGSLTIPPSTGPAYFCYLRIAMAGWRGAGPGSAQRARPRRTHRDKTQYTRRGWVRQPKHYHEDESGEATTSEFRNLLILRLCRPVISEPASAYSSNAPNPLPIAPRYRLAVIEGLGGRLLLTH